MNPLDDLLQERLAQWEAGKDIENCLADLPDDEALWLRKAVALRSTADLIPLPVSLDAQRAEFLRFAQEKRSAVMRTSNKKPASSWLLPAALAGGALAIFACLVVYLTKIP